jgi:hypothetical protein
VLGYRAAPMTRYFSDRELERLRELRSTFLSFEVKPASEHGGGEAYWEAEEELALYDRTFARRIAWKWDAVVVRGGAGDDDR